MEDKEVTDLYKLLEENGVQVWIDGGWGVDALLEKQTRPHKDLDIALEWKDVPKLRELLSKRGYKQIREDNKWNFVLADEKGHEIDVHAVIYDEQGNFVDGIEYPKESLTGTGKIAGQTVRCVSVEYTIKFHSGYELKEKDYQGVSALCEKFGIDLPEEYEHFKK